MLDYPKYIESEAAQDFQVRDRHHGQGNYLSPFFAFWIDPSQVRSIVEIGSRDGLDALALSAYYRCHVYAFECNPPAIEICRRNIEKCPNVTLIPKAVWNRTDKVSFYPVLPGEGKYNMGMSSCFRIDPLAPPSERHSQTEIAVPAVRMDEWMAEANVSGFDLVCMDVEGAALQVLEGFGAKLGTVRYLIVELNKVRFFENEALYPEVAAYLEDKGFVRAAEIDTWDVLSDVLFVYPN